MCGGQRTAFRSQVPSTMGPRVRTQVVQGGTPSPSHRLYFLFQVNNWWIMGALRFLKWCGCVINPKISRFLQTVSFYSLCNTDYPEFKFRQSLEVPAWISGLGPSDARTCFLILQAEMLNPSVAFKINPNPNLNPIVKYLLVHSGRLEKSTYWKFSF